MKTYRPHDANNVPSPKEVAHRNVGAPRCLVTEVDVKPTIVKLKLDGAPMTIMRVESGTSLEWCVRFPDGQFCLTGFANPQRAMNWLISGRPLFRSDDRHPGFADPAATLPKSPESRAIEFAPVDRRVSLNSQMNQKSDADAKLNRISGVNAGPEWTTIEQNGPTGTGPEWAERRNAAAPDWQVNGRRKRTDTEVTASERKARIGPEWQAMGWKVRTDS